MKYFHCTGDKNIQRVIACIRVITYTRVILIAKIWASPWDRRGANDYNAKMNDYKARMNDCNARINNCNAKMNDYNAEINNYNIIIN